jgi:photosynthetic reaction center cytochrome c subunit
MRIESKKSIFSAVGTTFACLVAAALLSGQASPPQKPPLAEEVFKNVQVLRGVPVNQFMEEMGFISASLGESCEYCHTLENTGWDTYAKDTDRKQTARRMMIMMSVINQTNFGGKREVTCFTCHRGGPIPRVTPTVEEVYSGADPVEQEYVESPGANAPSADQIFEKYIQALGGTQRLSSLMSFAAKGTSVGYGDERYERQVEIYAKSPSQRTTIIHMLTGDNTTAYDGHNGWVAAPITLTPVTVVPLTGIDLDAAKLDADLSFPAQIKQALTDWKVGSTVMIDNHPAQVIQGTTAAGGFVKLYFDKQSGLLVRQLRHSDSALGRVATQIDYGDYREVAGVKMPYHWLVTWLDGMSTFDLTEVRPNASIDSAKFGQPAPPVPPAIKPAAK